MLTRTILQMWGGREIPLGIRHLQTEADQGQMHHLRG